METTTVNTLLSRFIEYNQTKVMVKLECMVRAFLLSGDHSERLRSHRPLDILCYYYLWLNMRYLKHMSREI